MEESSQTGLSKTGKLLNHITKTASSRVHFRDFSLSLSPSPASLSSGLSPPHSTSVSLSLFPFPMPWLCLPLCMFHAQTGSLCVASGSSDLSSL